MHAVATDDLHNIIFTTTIHGTFNNS